MPDSLVASAYKTPIQALISAAAKLRERDVMDEHIDMDSSLCRAYWCGNFSCSSEELTIAVHVMDSTAVGLVGLYLATRSSEARDVNSLDVDATDRRATKR